MEPETLGKLEVEEERMITILATIAHAYTGRDIPMEVYMTLGLVYGYSPEEFFIRLANSTVKMAEKIGHGDEPIVGDLRDHLKKIDNKVTDDAPGNLDELI
jgi:hypothetical protein